MNIYDTLFMLAAVEELPPTRTFYKDRYFPTNTMLDIFGTARVFVDFKEGNKRLAPFVVPRIGGVSILREGFETFEIEPPNIAPSRSLTVDHLKNRNFGESILSRATPADRETFLLMSDLGELSDRITRREEWMAVETILGNGCVMKHITDREDVAFEEIEARYYSGDNNPALYTPATPWTPGSDSWRKDIRTMAKMLTRRGLPAVDLVVAPDVGDFIEADEWVKERLDNRRMDYGNLAPLELPNGTTLLGRLNFGGVMLNVIVSEDSYEDENGNDTSYLPAGSVIITAPGCGRTIYGGVTQIEDDGNFHTTAGTRVPQYIVTKKPAVKEIVLTSKPLMAPNRKSPWTVAKKVFD